MEPPYSGTFTYSVVSNSDGSLTINKVLPDATTKTHRWVIGDDGNVMILDGTAQSDKQRFRVAIRLDTAKTYTNADLIGDYYFERYMYDGSYNARSGIATFDGAGNRSTSRTDNADGIISTSTGTGTYSLNSNGSYTLDNGAIGYLTGDGKFGSDVRVTTSNVWSLALSMKKGDKTYSTADLAGTWAIASFWDDMGGPTGGTPFGATFGTMTCTTSGSCSSSWNSWKNQKSGVVTYESYTSTFSVASDGSFGASLATGAPSYSAAIGNNGDTIIFNSSFDATYPSVRGIYVAVKCSTCGDLAAVPSYNDYAGIWNGSIAWVISGENTNCTLAVNLAVNSNQLAGTMTGSNCTGGTMGTFNISGTVSNGIFSFNFPNSDTTNPDCANWNMPATATLDSNLTTMTLNSSGTVCGPTGGKPGSLTGTATKQ